MTDALVIGAGVVGLTTAICLAEAGLQVVTAAEPPERTTSAVAGAIWGPHLVEDSDRVTRWCADTLRTLTGLAGQPGAGVRLAQRGAGHPYPGAHPAAPPAASQPVPADTPVYTPAPGPVRPETLALGETAIITQNG